MENIPAKEQTTDKDWIMPETDVKVKEEEFVKEQPHSFEYELTELINQYSLENGSDTPDFILAEYLNNCLQTFNTALKARTRWYKPEVK